MEYKIDKYEYVPLDTPKDTRVLEFTPNSYDQKTMMFDFKLTTINLRDYDHPPYYALSYTWKSPDIEGDQVPSRPSPLQIRCDGRILGIEENLFDCLYQLAHLSNDDSDGSDNFTCIWIDAICINQADLEERSTQVAMMQDIYAQAAGTLIWLGRQDRNSLQAVPLIKKLAEVAGSYFLEAEEATYDTILSPGQLRDDEFFSSIGITPLTTSDWNSISLFFSRSWFHRVWTVQELAMGKIDSKVMLCGDTILSGEDIGGFIVLALVKGWVNTLRTLEFNRTRNGNAGTSLGIEISLGMEAIYKALPEGPMSGMLRHFFSFRDQESFIGAKFAWMLNVCRQKKATNERDRIFASSGMISEYRKPSWWHLLGPDYSMSTEDVFTNASKLILQCLGNLAWLSFVEDNSMRVHKNLPSWVPDLATVARPTSLASFGCYNVFRNCGDFVDLQQPLGPLILLHDTSLYVKGYKLDKLAYTTYDLNKTFLDYKLSYILIAAARFTTYEPGDSWLDALMKTLALGTSFELDLNSDPAAPPSSQSFDQLRPSFLHFLRLQIAQEMWRWKSSQTKEASNWWEAHADFARVCDSDSLLPSREEFEEFFSIFSALYPSHQDEKANPIIEDKEFLEIMYNPATPYARRYGPGSAFRAFIQTQHARMGVAPLSARPEDEIWILKGAKVPFILRQQHDDSYELIGEAYIHGIMQGEFFQQGNNVDFRYILLK